ATAGRDAYLVADDIDIPDGQAHAAVRRDAVAGAADRRLVVAGALHGNPRVAVTCHVESGAFGEGPRADIDRHRVDRHVDRERGVDRILDGKEGGARRKAVIRVAARLAD